MKRTAHRKSFVFMVMCFLMTAFVGMEVLAGVDRYWGNTGTDFNAGASWTNTTAPGSGDRAFFATDRVTQPRLSTSASVFGLFFTPGLGTNSASATPACGGYVLSGEPGTVLTLTASGYNYSGVYMIEQCTTGTNVISAGVAFPDAAFLANRYINLVSGTLEFSGSIAGNENNIIRLGGTGNLAALIVSGDNSGFTGGFTKSSAVPVFIRHRNAFSKLKRIEFTIHGAGSPTFNRFVNEAGGPLVFENNPAIFLNGGDGIIIDGNYPINFGTNTVTFNDSNAGRNCPLTINVPLVKIGGPTVQTGANNGYVKKGTGTLEVSGRSSYLAETIIADGVFLARHSEAFSPSNAVCITKLGTIGGILGLGYGDFTNPIGTSAGCVYSKTSGGYSNTGGWAAYGADRKVNIGGAFQGVTNVAPFLSNIILGAANADATVTFQNPLYINSMSFFSYNGSADVDGRISGVITNYNTSTATVSKYGNGTLELTATNTLAGTMNIYEGELRVSGALGASLALNVKTNGAVLGGGGKMSGAVTVEKGGALSIDNRLGTTTFEGNLTLNAGANMQITLDGSNKTGIRFAGTGKTLKNLGAVDCYVYASNRNVWFGTLTVIDWTDAASPNVTGLNPVNFTIQNPEMTGSFEIQGTKLVLKYRDTLQHGTMIRIH